MANGKYYKVLVDAKEKVPELKMKSIKLEKLTEEQKKEFDETRAENNGKAAWLMPSGGIFWAGAEMEINNAKKIVSKAKKKGKKKQKRKK